MKETKTTIYTFTFKDEDFKKRNKVWGFREDISNAYVKGLKLLLNTDNEVQFRVRNLSRKISDAYEEMYEAFLWALPCIPELQLTGCETAPETWERLEELKNQPGTSVDLIVYIVRVECLLKDIESHFDPMDYDFDGHYFKKAYRKIKKKK